MKNENVPEIRFKGFVDAWEQRKLKDLAEFNPKSTLPYEFEYVDLESVVGTDLVSHRTELKESSPSRAQRLAQRGDVFYQTVRPYQKNNYLYDLPYNNYVFSTGYAQMRPSIDSYFLFSHIQEEQFVKDVLDRSTGTSYPAIKSNDLAEIEIKVPVDSGEQEKVGSFFRTLDDTIALHKGQLDKLKLLKKSCLQQMFPKNGEKVPRIRFADFHGEWEERKVSEIAPLQRGFDLPVSGMITGGYPVVMSNGIGGYHNKYKVKGPGVVTGRSGTIGKMQYIECDYWPHNTALWVTSFKNSIPKYIYYMYQKLDLSKYGTGSGVPTLNRNDVHDCVIPIPKTEEQIKITEHLSNLDNLITLHAGRITELKKFKKICLQKMLI
ncbi:restriction endonuclease subunit S [Lacrimispora sp.]|uniref:restriction endonuclease subunit S n=1 Tax=Lacrimispora sp. TaxID=2719234 RepID=UPI00345FAC45